MAQAPATPKLRRLATRLRAGMGLGPGTGLQASERAALAMRAAGPVDPPGNPVVRFLIPLVGRHHVGDWASVEARLAATLASLAAQTDPGWEVVLCGQDRPDLPEDPRITWLPFTREVAGNDKWAKLFDLTAHLAARPAVGYAMPFDADDLLAPWVVAHMRATRAPGGYLVTRGYVYDAGSGGLALARPQSLWSPGQKAFWKLCGSAAAFRCDGARGEDVAFLQAATQHEHRMFPYLAALAGRPLAPLPRPAALYILNHGENFGVRRGRVTFKTRFVTRFPVTDPSERQRVAEDFGLEI